MILILECGSTKSDWLLISKRGKELSFSDHGINPSTLSREDLELFIHKGSERIAEPDQITKIYHYGAGVSGAFQQKLLTEIYSNLFPNAILVIESDMLAAVRATLGDEKGIVCILGTGSNSCYFNGSEIVANYQGFGYLIGDEGGGVDIGTRMIKLYYSDSLPEHLSKELDDELANRSEFVKKLYSHNKPNRYLALFCPFANKHQQLPVIRQEIEDSFDELVKNYLSKYPEIDKLPINFVGSISKHFRSILTDTLMVNGLKAGKFATRPIVELEKYHYKKLQNE